MRTVLVTGGCGFIGTNFIRHAHTSRADWNIVNLDALTYAANPKNLKSLEGSSRYVLEHGDISQKEAVFHILNRVKPDWIVHFAAESHVDRSIALPDTFVSTNVMGTFNLLEWARQSWRAFDDKLFLHVSTDEVYGSLGETGLFTEESPYDPSSPYSASKASSDHLVQAYHRTYGLPTIITHSSNNYGPYQFPEKLIPLVILNATEGKPLPVYGDGSQVRDWIEVTDHCRGLLMLAEAGTCGEKYNVGGSSERTNLEVVEAICDGVAERLGKDPGSIRAQIEFVTDRPGHDFRYALDTAKTHAQTGWTPEIGFHSGIRDTIRWYLGHSEWIREVRTGAYREWIAQHYGRGTPSKK